MQCKYQQLRNDLLSELVLGKRLPGTILPSERDLARSYGMSRVSVRHAIDCLLKEGFLEKFPDGRNVFCGLPAEHSRKKFLLVMRNLHSVLPDIYRMLYEALLLKCSLAEISLFCYSEVNLADISSLKCEFDAVLGLGISRFPKKNFNTDRLILLDEGGTEENVRVTTDNFAGGVMAADHLLKCGYRHPLFLGIADHEKGQSFRKRMLGFCSRMEEAGIKVPCRYAASSSALSVLSVLRSWPELKSADSLFVLHDYFAVNAYHALRRMRISIPDDLAVISFDGLASGAYLVPSLTTVLQPVNDIADKALELALSAEKLQGDMLLPPELLIRKSTPNKCE